MSYRFIIKSIDNKVVYTSENKFIYPSDAQRAGSLVLRNSPYMTGTERVEVISESGSLYKPSIIAHTKAHFRI